MGNCLKVKNTNKTGTLFQDSMLSPSAASTKGGDADGERDSDSDRQPAIMQAGQSNNDRYVCSLYMNPCMPASSLANNSQNAEEPVPPLLEQLSSVSLRQTLTDLQTAGRWVISETPSGLIVAFSREEDADRLLQTVNLAHVFGGSVQVAKFPSGEPKFRQVALIRDVPWLIPPKDLYAAFNSQGITVGALERCRQHLKAEILNAGDFERLLRDGLNFFGVTNFPAVPERSLRSEGNYWNHTDAHYGAGPSMESDILQCYRCQGFWHVAANCRHLPRCVRCGEPHGVEYCPRPRNNPICCHCNGSHHAAYKQCPVRMQLINATPVNFSLSMDRNPRGNLALPAAGDGDKCVSNSKKETVSLS